MSGSDGGGPTNGSPSRCEDLSFATALVSPKPNVIEKIEVGDVLDVGVQQEGAQTVVVVLRNGERAGGITASEVAELRECLIQGHKYQAKVQSKNDGQVTVRISIKK